MAKTARKLYISRFFLLLGSLILYHTSNCQTKAAFFPANTGFGFIENKGQLVDQNGRPNLLVKYILVLRNGMKIQLTGNGFSYETFTESVKADPGNPALTTIAGRQSRAVAKEIRCHRVDVSMTCANPHPEIQAEDSSASNFIYYTPNTGQSGIKAKSFRKITYKNIYKGIDLVFVANPSDTLISFEYYFVVTPIADAGVIKLKYKGALKTSLDSGRIAITVNRGTFRERIPESFLATGSGEIQIKGHSSNSINVSYKSNGNDEYRFRVPAYDKTKTLIIDPTPDLIWGTYYGGSGNDFADALAKDVNNNFFICGYTDSQETLATAGAYQTVLDGPQDGFIGKFDNGGSLLWLTYYGGSSFDALYGIKIDQEGNVLTAGETYSRDNIATPGAYQTTDNTTYVVPLAFLLKMDNNGNRIWCTYYGGNILAEANAVAVDSKNNVFITGYTQSNAGISTPGAYQTAYAGSLVAHTNSAFLAKFDQNGALVWATYYGGTGGEIAFGLCVDLQDNVLITGTTASTSGLSTSGGWQPASGSPAGDDAFLAKFNNDGQLQWATFYGGTKSDASNCVAVDQANNIIIGGLTNSPNNIASPGALQTTVSLNVANIDYEAFVAKFTASGDRIWGTYYGNGIADNVLCITTDGQNNIYLGGMSGSTMYITTPGSYQPQPQTSSTNAFLSEMSSTGVLQWGTYYGIPGSGKTSGIVELSDGSVVVTGTTESTSNIATCGAVQPNYAGENDIFLGKFGENVTHGPSITVTAAATGPVCPNAPLSFNATADNGGYSPVYQWLVNGSDVGNNGPVYTANNLADGDRVSCFLTSNSACVSSDTASSNVITVSILTPSQPEINITASADTICSGATVRFTANATTNSPTPEYQWMVNGNDIGANNALYASNILNDGDLVNCIVTDNACNLSYTAASNKIQMTVNTNILNPSISITASSDTVCAGTPITFTAIASKSGNNPQYQWTVNGVATGADSNIFQSGTLSEGDTINCMLSPGYHVCWTMPQAISNTLGVKIYPTPAITLIATDTSMLAGASIQFNPDVTGNIVDYQWTPASGLSNPEIENPIASPVTSTTYQLTVTSVNDCQATAKILVEVLRYLHMPNAFTPDMGKNNIFRIPTNTSLTLTDFCVYNRWGAQIFGTTDPNVGWDGTFKGTRCEPGAYVYFISGSDNKGLISVKGTVLLIR